MCREIVVGSRVRFIPDCEPRWLDIEMYNRTRLDVIAVRGGWVTVRTMGGTVRRMRTPEFRELFLTDADDGYADDGYADDGYADDGYADADDGNAVHVWVSGFRLKYADRTAAIIEYVRSACNVGIMVDRQFATMRGE
jgi:hypothetical protein